MIHITPSTIGKPILTQLKNQIKLEVKEEEQKKFHNIKGEN